MSHSTLKWCALPYHQRFKAQKKWGVPGPLWQNPCLLEASGGLVMGATVPCRIAMWSGPRNLSTALLRSWGNREDTHVVDEPFYAHYLTRKETNHPGVDEVIASHETDWAKVAAQLTGPLPPGKTVLYQKHMAHHLMPHMDRSWLTGMVNCFLIRDPREVLNSLSKKMPSPTVLDTGFPQEAALFDHVREQTGSVPPVIDARDVLKNPEAVLRLLCERVGVPFSDRMLSWPPGTRDTDGVWGKHWYANVNASTGFQVYTPRGETLAAEHDDVYRASLVHYRKLYEHRLTAGDV
jgi:hypothetical protein